MVKTKENILVISPTIPNPNKSAGDYRVYTLLKELKKFFNISFMPLDYKKSIKQDIFLFPNIEIVKPIKSTKLFKNFIDNKNIDICIFEKYFSMPFDLYKFIPLIKTSIIDVHEIGFLKSEALSNINKIDNLKLFKAKELLFYKNAKILIAITEKEKKELQKYFPNKKIIVIPTCTKILKTNKTFEQRKDICYFGFYHHNPNTDAVNYFIKNIFKKIKIPNLNFYILGNGSKNIKNTKNIISVDNITNISKELSKYKLFVCPLRYGAGLKKKTLDAMAAKTPIISTMFGLEGIKKIEQNYYDINSESFINKIIELYNNKKIWQKESNQNFNIVQKYYSLKSFKQYVAHFVKQLNSTKTLVK